MATLYWSERGAVACERHTPYRGSDTWVWERWTAITDADREAWMHEVGAPPKCETCKESR